APGRAGCHAFVFRAEDGIRGRNVTGVQTCALPISISTRWASSAVQVTVQLRASATGRRGTITLSWDTKGVLPLRSRAAPSTVTEIGRASCRDGGWMTLGGAPSDRQTSTKLVQVASG